MITGECPYDDCHEIHTVAIADQTPSFSKYICDGCKREYWIKHSRINPEAMTPKNFDEKFIIDEATRTISNRVNP